MILEKIKTLLIDISQFEIIKIIDNLKDLLIKYTSNSERILEDNLNTIFKELASMVTEQVLISYLFQVFIGHICYISLYIFIHNRNIFFYSRVQSLIESTIILKTHKLRSKKV